MKLTTVGITTTIFWIGFMSFLSMSIPHVAWLYQVYEPTTDWYSILTSYGIAIGIDVMIAWLSYICAKGKVTDVRVTVTFIIALSALSYYANYLFDMANNPIKQNDIWSIRILFGFTTTGYLTPLVISAIPFFSLAYTFMLSRLAKTQVDLTELEEALKNKQAVKKLKEQYQDTGKTTLETKAKEAITSVISIGKHAANQLSKDNSKESLTPNQETVLTEVNDTSKNDPTDNLDDTSSGLSSSRNVPLEEASKLLQYDVSTVKRMVSRGKLKAPNGSSQLVTLASINVLLKKKQSGVKESSNGHIEQIERDTDKLSLPVLTLVTPDLE